MDVLDDQDFYIFFGCKMAKGFAENIRLAFEETKRRIWSLLASKEEGTTQQMRY